LIPPLLFYQFKLLRLYCEFVSSAILYLLTIYIESTSFAIKIGSYFSLFKLRTVRLYLHVLLNPSSCIICFNYFSSQDRNSWWKIAKFIISLIFDSLAYPVSHHKVVGI